MKNYFIIILFLLIACSNERIVNDYYKDGKLKSSKYFHNDDTLPYIKIDYYQSGEVKDSLKYDLLGRLSGVLYFNYLSDRYHKWTKYERGKANGPSFVFKSDGTKIIQHFIDGQVQGVETQFHSTGLIRKVYWSRGKPLFYRDVVSLMPGDTVESVLLTQEKKGLEKQILTKKKKSEFVYRIEGDKSYSIGSLDMDTLGNVIKSNNNCYVKSFVQELNDTSVVCFQGYLGNIKDASLKMEFGKMVDSDFIPDSSKIYSSGDMKICVPVNNIINSNHSSILARISISRDAIVLYNTFYFEDFSKSVTCIDSLR